MAQRELTGGLVHTPFLQGLPALISEPWRRYFAETATESNAVPSVTTVTIAARNSAISATPFPAPTLNAGLYRVTAYVRIVTAAVTSSAVTPQVVCTDDSDVVTQTGDVVNGNTATTVGSSTFLVRIDAGTPISYAFGYASNGAGEMEFEAELVLEQIG